MEENEFKELTVEQTEVIKKKVLSLKKEKQLAKIIPIVVFGDKEEGDTKDFYVGYFRKPTLMEYSKIMTLMKRDETNALKVLAKDCFVDGDKELVDNDDMFLYGTSSQLVSLIKTRESKIVNF